MLDLFLPLPVPLPNPAVELPAIMQLAQANPAAKALPPAPRHPAEFTSSNPAITGQMQIAFQDEFDGPAIATGGAGPWSTTYFWGARTMATNQEEQFYVDPGYTTKAGSKPGVNPFEIDKGVLSIVARRAPESLVPDLEGHRFTSGMLTTYKSFAFRYGFVEFRAKVPRGRSMWPAVWMLRRDQGKLGELDILEVFGQRTTFLNSTIHTPETGTVLLVRKDTPDLAEDFHTYGMHWSPEKVTVYLDGREMGSAPTPEGLKGPMYLLVNLAVGGKWPGPTNSSTPDEARFQLDYIRVWQRPEDKAADMR